MVQYHPKYSGYRSLGDGTAPDLVDLTQGNEMFWPPEGQEWFMSIIEPDTPQMEVNDSRISPVPATAVEYQFDEENMLPYLSPTSLFRDEEERVRARTASNWGGYSDDSLSRQELLHRWQEPVSEKNSNQNSIAIIASANIETATAVPSTGVQGLTSGGTYKIPKLPGRGISSTKTDEQVSKESTSVRAILPKPPGTISNPRPFCHPSGSKTQKKKM